jgi:hypothetical protein
MKMSVMGIGQRPCRIGDLFERHLTAGQSLRGQTRKNGDFMRRLLLVFPGVVWRCRLAVPGVALLIATLLIGAMLIGDGAAIAQSGDVRAQDQSQKPPAPGAAAATDAAKDNQRKTDEFAEAAQVLNGPAGNPECVWLGRRVVSLMWRDDLDTAFRHLDLYDRFGCPGGHVQAAFRCLTRFGSLIDPKVPTSLNGLVHGCWINPNAQPQPPAAPPPAAGTTATAPASPAPAAAAEPPK